MVGRFLAALESLGPLSVDERSAVDALFGPPRVAMADTELVGDGAPATDCHLLLSGQAFRHKTLADGRRQIVGFVYPGDFLDLQRLFLDPDYGVTALIPCRLAPVALTRLEDLLPAHPRVARALQRLCLVEASLQREWMVGMGRRSAYARVAHLLCEHFLQLGSAGLSQGAKAPFPLTQHHLADAVGLSSVHMNRVLQVLRAEGLIALRARQLVILDWAGLVSAGEFDPAYLHLTVSPDSLAPPPVRSRVRLSD